ncbi:hypothetical protein F5Y00DRAFT_273332 [Daldinia vernicosa]|uniref:uncharacterized protein n=1 Tax=Daldinia vernicosa TaxID=114800 RepID=UPI002007E9C8|nr:uncharacterized protein F5Y00DRAFT_273332 [Daldinia vernicosa]KAI0845071.1 hypothetical protein F5Y00DRAFT_273332 [Daldinia vernicosa]
MAGRWRTAYKYSSLCLTINDAPAIEGGDATIAEDGFLVLEIANPGFYLVQSLVDWEIYHVKVLRKHLHLIPRDQVRTREFLHPSPPEVRVSTMPSAEFRNVEDDTRLLSDDEYFQKLIYFQSDGENWTLYHEYMNGGSLEYLIKKYQSVNRSIPEIFIWHVTAELCKAIAYLYFGWTPLNRSKIQGWDRIYHRAITPSNILLNYAPRNPGAVPRVGIESNAFPRIALCNFSHSALIYDLDAWLKPGLHPTEATTNDWEDVHHLGCVLRLMCMTHIPLGAGLVPGEHWKDEQGEHAWSHRPDSRLVRDANATPGPSHPGGPGYSDRLMELLGRFEWDNQRDQDVTTVGEWGYVAPTLDWVVDTLLFEAETMIWNFRRPGEKPRGHFTNVDVSWTRPLCPLIPVLYDDQDEDDPNVDPTRMEYLLKTQRRFMRNCELQFPIPKFRERDDNR